MEQDRTLGEDFADSVLKKILKVCVDLLAVAQPSDAQIEEIFPCELLKFESCDVVLLECTLAFLVGFRV